MFSYIIGEVNTIRENYIVLENNNIGYKIFMSERHISSLVKGETRKVYTHFSVSDSAVELYGFLEFDEVEMFLTLNNISGVGPKAALAIISSLTVYQINKAIIENDINGLSKAKGIGKKTASRIILDLSDKIDMSKLKVLNTNTDIIKIEKNNNFYVAVEALVNLGYNKSDAENVLKNLDIKNMELSDIIKTALKRI